jgi:hypothetical protein
MRKSKYLVLNSLYFDFNDDLTEITNVKKSFEKQNILDLLRFDKITIIKKQQFDGESINSICNFVFFNENIRLIDSGSFSNSNIIYVNFSNCINLREIKYYAFGINNIKIVDVSNCINFKAFCDCSFFRNKIKRLKLNKNILIIEQRAFLENEIIKLDLSQCDSLSTINFSSFEQNKIKELELHKNIKEISRDAFAYNKIKLLDLTKSREIIEIEKRAFSYNDLQEIRILDHVLITFDESDLGDRWHTFIKFYHINKGRGGIYTYNKPLWKWHPL